MEPEDTNEAERPYRIDRSNEWLRLPHFRGESGFAKVQTRADGSVRILSFGWGFGLPFFLMAPVWFGFALYIYLTAGRMPWLGGVLTFAGMSLATIMFALIFCAFNLKIVFSTDRKRCRFTIRWGPVRGVDQEIPIDDVTIYPCEVDVKAKRLRHGLCIRCADRWALLCISKRPEKVDAYLESLPDFLHARYVDSLHHVIFHANHLTARYGTGG